MKKKSKNRLDNGAIAKLASITSTAITTFQEKQKQKKKELALKRKKEEMIIIENNPTAKRLITKPLLDKYFSSISFLFIFIFGALSFSFF